MRGRASGCHWPCPREERPQGRGDKVPKPDGSPHLPSCRFRETTRNCGGSDLLNEINTFQGEYFLAPPLPHCPVSLLSPALPSLLPRLVTQWQFCLADLLFLISAVTFVPCLDETLEIYLPSVLRLISLSAAHLPISCSCSCFSFISDRHHAINSYFDELDTAPSPPPQGKPVS